jgi:hypothetical protein
MIIRAYQPGDEAAQAAIYNEAAGDLPKFKPAAVDEVRRRCQATDFDPATRFYAEDNGQVVGYAVFHPNGRVSYPWCRKGAEHAAGPLFQAVLQAMTARRIPTAFAAYRADWPRQLAFFQEHGFRLAQEMVNFVLELADMPTRIERLTAPTQLRREDIPALLALAPGALRSKTPAELEKHCFENPYFPTDAFFVLRNRRTGAPDAVGILIQNGAYADPRQVDAAMPCFRLGAFGTEGMQVKRLNGLFSVLARNEADLLAQANALMGYAAEQFERSNGDALTPRSHPMPRTWLASISNTSANRAASRCTSGRCRSPGISPGHAGRFLA